MWNKIYTVALGIFFVLMTGLTYYAYTWLQSVSAPASVVQNYDHYSHINRIFLWISSLILLVLANVVLWTTRNGWAMWATFLYFALFILIQTLWLENMFFNYQRENGLTDRVLSFGVASGILFTVFAAAVVYFDQFIVKRMHDKMFQPPIATENPTNNVSDREV